MVPDELYTLALPTYGLPIATKESVLSRYPGLGKLCASISKGRPGIDWSPSPSEVV